jgi:hypothetical protein
MTRGWPSLGIGVRVETNIIPEKRRPSRGNSEMKRGIASRSRAAGAMRWTALSHPVPHRNRMTPVSDLEIALPLTLDLIRKFCRFTCGNAALAALAHRPPVPAQDLS